MPPRKLRSKLLHTARRRGYGRDATREYIYQAMRDLGLSKPKGTSR